MADLHVFCDDAEWYVAESVNHAKRLQREFSGCSAQDQEAYDWSEWSDDSELRIWLDPETTDVSYGDGSDVLVLGSCAEWAAAYGPGFLCSTEY